jgi:hypothetical protein
MCDTFVVICRVCKLVRLLELLVVTSYKCSVNPIINPNPVSSHYIVTIYTFKRLRLT